MKRTKLIYLMAAVLPLCACNDEDDRAENRTEESVQMSSAADASANSTAADSDVADTDSTYSADLGSSGMSSDPAATGIDSSGSQIGTGVASDSASTDGVVSDTSTSTSTGSEVTDIRSPASTDSTTMETDSVTNSESSVASDSSMVSDTAGSGSYSHGTIMDVQKSLRGAGYDVRPDGVMGSQTVTAIRQFQAARGLSQTGILDVATLTALNVTPEEAQRAPASTPSTTLPSSDPMSAPTDSNSVPADSGLENQPAPIEEEQEAN